MLRSLVATTFALASFALVHCGSNDSPTSTFSSSSSGGNQGGQASTSNPSPTPSQRPSPPPPPPSPPPPLDAGAGPIDAAWFDANRPAPVDASPPPVPAQPGPVCQALAGCCNFLDPTSAASCQSIVNRKEEQSCQGAYNTFHCSGGGGGAPVLGPACAQLASCCYYDPYIQGDPPCTYDWRTGNEAACADDLDFYQSDPWGDCL